MTRKARGGMASILAPTAADRMASVTQGAALKKVSVALTGSVVAGLLVQPAHAIANALVRFNPRTARFTRIRLPSSPADVRQILGRRGEVWGAESGVDKLVVVRTR